MTVLQDICGVCGADSSFDLSDGAALRREARCTHCGATVRNSDLAKVIVELFAAGRKSLRESLDLLAKLRILEAGTGGVIHDILSPLPGYHCFEFFDDIQPGQMKDGKRCEDLRALTYPDALFDLVITQDVLEHVDGTESAFAEIFRVLRDGGRHVFTVPLHEGHTTLSRQGLPNVFHADPVRAEGTRVCTDWGDDLPAIADAAGFRTSFRKMHEFYPAEQITWIGERGDATATEEPVHFRYNSVVIVSEKSATAAFTGERFIPGKTEASLQAEHEQRYRWARQFAAGKRVVDVACGEGYGSDLLAAVAQDVLGVDIDAATVESARRRYGRANLDFRTGSVTAIPVADASVDLLVSFETLEHVSESDQAAFVGEIRRILKPGGFAIISTPDRVNYSERMDYRNEFHIHELSRTEFTTLLEQSFARVKIFAQRQEVAMLLSGPGMTTLLPMEAEAALAANARYLVALCGDTVLPVASTGSIVFEPDDERYRQQRRILQLQSEVEELATWGRKLDAEAIELRDEVQRRGEWGLRLDAEIRQKDARILELQEEVRRLGECRGGQEASAGATQPRSSELQDFVPKMNSDAAREMDARWQKGLDAQVRHLQALQQEKIRQIGELRRQFDQDQTILARNAKLIRVSDAARSAASLVVRASRFAWLAAPHCTPANLAKFNRKAKTEGLPHAMNRVYRFVAERSEALRPNPATTQPLPSLDIPACERPLVSVIVPVHNQLNYTVRCLEAIRDNTRSLVYEVIIGDDASTDETRMMAQIAPNVRVVRHETNLGFVGNCNAAAKVARGQFLFFLNNDACVQPGWLEPLLDLMRRDQSVGIVGSKLVYPDGRLQEAGGIYWRDGSAWNYGRYDDPEKAPYNYVRNADYISGAAIMVRRELWAAVGGFDVRYAPAYCEDADLAFEARRHGYKVLYQPMSVVVHHEGISHGTDEDISSAKRALMEANVAKFREKWKQTLEAEHFANGQDLLAARDRSAGQKVMLVIDHYVPHFDRDAGSRCMYDYLKLFLKMGLHVKFIGDNFFRHEPYTQHLQQMGIEVLYGNEYVEGWKDWVSNNAHRLDYVFLNRPHIATKYLDYLRAHTKAKILYYGHDLHFMRSRRAAEVTGDATMLQEADHWERIERELFAKCDVIYYPSTVETAMVREMVPQAVARTIPLYLFSPAGEGHEVGMKSRRDLLFVGGFAHAPNKDAVLCFASEVLPEVQRRIPGVRLVIAGSNPPDEVLALACEQVIVTGAVPDNELRQLYLHSRVTVVPLRFGAGVKGKVCESLHYGCPLVTTSIGAEGLPDISAVAWVRDTAADFGAAIVEAYLNDEMAMERARAGQAYAKKHLSEAAALAVIGQDIDPN